MALVLAFLSAENENRQLEDLPLADFGRLPERLLLSVRTKAINENFLNWKLRPLLFLWFNAFFHLKSQHQRTLRLLFEDCRLIYFHSLMKSAFLPSEGLLCLYDKQNNTWLLVGMEFEEKFHIYARPYMILYIKTFITPLYTILQYQGKVTRKVCTDRGSPWSFRAWLSFWPSPSSLASRPTSPATFTGALLTTTRNSIN